MDLVFHEEGAKQKKPHQITGKPVIDVVSIFQIPKDCSTFFSYFLCPYRHICL